MIPHRILLDGYWLSDGPPSGRNVVHSLIHGWSEAFPDDTIAVAVPAKIAVASLPDSVNMEVIPTHIANHGFWVATQLSKRSSFDAILSQNFTPLTVTQSARVAVFYHDAIVQEHQEWFTLRERAYLRLASLGLRKAHIVLTSSQSEAARIRKVLPAVADRVFPVGLAVPHALAQASASRPPNLTDAHMPFILAVGRLNVRKNLRRLISAFTSSRALREYRLIIVGDENGRSELLPSALDRVHFLGYVSDGQLRWLYENCAVFAFPSLDEGFGLPLLEADHFGAVRVASDIPSFREVASSGVFFQPEDEESMRIALERSLQLKEREPPTRQEESWTSIATRIRECLFSD